MENSDARPPHVAILPLSGMGHLIPLAELAKLLVARHGFTVTFLTYGGSTASRVQQSVLDALPESISSISLPPVSLSDLPADARIETVRSVEAARSVPAVAATLRDLKLKTRLVAFVFDLFGTDNIDAAREAGVPHYLFIPSNLLFLSLMFAFPELDATTSCEFRDLPGPVQLPGCVPLPGPELLHGLQDRSNECYKWTAHHAKRYREANGIMVNTFQALEPGAAEVLREAQPGRPPVYLVGPLIRTGSPDAVDQTGCVEWLDRQPAASVLFVSFGSRGALTKAQMHELALGLEASGHRFLWVVRSPIDGVDGGADQGVRHGGLVMRANYDDMESKRHPFGHLPPGFVERTKGVGMVVLPWAPQIPVLGHRATGGFLSHCGWNSTLESVAHGVPMITWPLFAEQRQNAVMLCEGAGVALRPRVAAGLVGREEVARVVRELMAGEQGRRAREKAAQLGEAAEIVPGEGDAAAAIAEVVGRWKRGVPELDVGVEV